MPFTGLAMNGVNKETLDEFNITSKELSTARADHKYNYIISNKYLSPTKVVLKAKVIQKGVISNKIN